MSETRKITKGEDSHLRIVAAAKTLVGYFKAKDMVMFSGAYQLLEEMCEADDKLPITERGKSKED